jgi:tetratricopeptide (TPR) repeat protein
MIRIGRVLLLLIANLAVVLFCEGAYRSWRSLTAPSPDLRIDRFELYGVGESTMVGQPYAPAVSIPQLLEYMFRGQIGGRSIVLKNLAEASVPLYPQSIAFEQAMASRNDRAPGVVLIISGHNEGIRPDDSAADGPTIPHMLTERSALVRDMLIALRRRHVVAREHTLSAYEYYLRRVIETAQHNGLVPIVATMASNISRVEPNYDHDDTDVRQVIARGIALEDSQRFAEARSLYANALRGRDHAQAPLEYQAGRCEETLGNFAAARELYWDAVDHDPRTSFGRATRAQNDLVRRLAREYDIPLVDTVAIFESHSPHAILSPAWFIDGQHPSLAGYVLLANAYADILSKRFETPIVQPLHDADQAIAALHVDAGTLRLAMLDAGDWLIAASVDHPFPRDRVALATALFRAALNTSDDLSAWLGIGLGQAALRGGLRSTDPVSRACHYTNAGSPSSADIAAIADRFAALGVDAEVVEQVRRPRQ